MSRRSNWLLIVVVLGVMFLGARFWARHGLLANAKRNDTVANEPISTGTRVVAEGRVTSYPGAYVEIGSEMPGLVKQVNIQENHFIEKGELIAELKSDEIVASLDEAKARVNELDAEEILAESEWVRSQRLARTRAISSEEVDRAARDLSVIRARKSAAEATVQRLQAVLSKTRIAAPFSGTVLRRYIDPGQTIEANGRLATLADLTRERIEAEVDEYDAARVQLGQPVKITAEGFPERSWRGTVEEVPAVVVDKSLQPRDPSRPIDVRVLLVEIAFAESTPLKLGQRVDIEIQCQEQQKLGAASNTSSN